MKVHMDGCEALKALFNALFPPSEGFLVLGSSYSTAEGGGEQPGIRRFDLWWRC